MERNKHRQRAYHLRRRHHRDSSKLPWFGSIASREEEWQADKQTGEEVVVVVCAVAKQAMMHRHVAEALPPPSLATSYRFCFLPCRRDPSSATKEPDAPPNLNNAPTTDDSLGLQTDRQRRERERERGRERQIKHARGGGTWMNGCNEMELRERTTTRATERALAHKRKTLFTRRKFIPGLAEERIVGNCGMDCELLLRVRTTNRTNAMPTQRRKNAKKSAFLMSSCLLSLLLRHIRPGVVGGIFFAPAGTELQRLPCFCSKANIATAMIRELVGDRKTNAVAGEKCMCLWNQTECCT